MAVFVLDTQHQAQLLTLQAVDPDTAWEFCKVALQLFRGGPQPRMIEKAAKKLDWPPEKLQTTLEAIMALFKEAVKAEIQPEDLQASLTSAGLQSHYAVLLVAAFGESRQEIQTLLQDTTFDTARLKAFDWRFEVEIASRTIHSEIKPHFLLRLELGKQAASSVHLLQMDIPTLIHVTEELESALQDVKSTHAKKMMRHAK
ncbi:putative COMM domain-containing protein 2 [Hypsibius exemplaris]|uniref:COMM domain-containing protein 2 n=1 Tax=Hypsibius exemplaris TaxID=2072580 RepID=A0A9X6NEN7_HYPEX|nr:putative COMM domain-containing protein 2 [Hypsibius exemplaris]